MLPNKVLHSEKYPYYTKNGVMTSSVKIISQTMIKTKDHPLKLSHNLENILLKLSVQSTKLFFQ